MLAALALQLMGLEQFLRPYERNGLRLPGPDGLAAADLGAVGIFGSRRRVPDGTRRFLPSELGLDLRVFDLAAFNQVAEMVIAPILAGTAGMRAMATLDVVQVESPWDC